jgi:hypothetical protein
LIVTLKFLKSIETTKLRATVTQPDKVSTPYGKKLTTESAYTEFKGFQVLSTGQQTIVSISNFLTSGTTSFGTTGAVGVVSGASLFSNALAFLTKMIQIIEFTSFMELFNVEYDASMGGLLRAIANATELKLLNVPTGSLFSNADFTVATQWKGKLSQVDVVPYILQEIGYPGVILLVSKPKKTSFFNLSRSSTSLRLSCAYSERKSIQNSRFSDSQCSMP